MEEAYKRLVIKRLDEMIEILNGLEYLHESDEDSVSSGAIPLLAYQIKERLGGCELVSQQLKSRLTKLVVDLMFPSNKLYKVWNCEQKAIEASVFVITGDSFDFKKVTYQPPENITISQAIVLFKIFNRHRLKEHILADGRVIDELKIYNTIDKDARRDVDSYFNPNGFSSCTIL
jgi:hypothetical protein